MQIRCHHCNFSREVDLSKIPPTVECATCPKCGFRFRFRAVDLETVAQPKPPEPDPKHVDVWDAVDSLQDRWAQPYEEKNRQEPEGTHTEPKSAAEHQKGSPNGGTVPWENPQQLGFSTSFVRTTLWAFLQPSTFFPSLTQRPPLLPALSYYVLLGVAQILLNTAWLHMLLALVHDSLSDSRGAFAAAFELTLDAIAFSPALLAMPFLLAVRLFVAAGIIHGTIRIINPQKANFTLTIKVVAYSSAGIILNLIPIAGILVGSLWQVVLLVIGCRYAFAFSWGKALTALAPLYLLMFLIASLGQVLQTSGI